MNLKKKQLGLLAAVRDGRIQASCIDDLMPALVFKGDYHVAYPYLDVIYPSKSIIHNIRFNHHYAIVGEQIRMWISRNKDPFLNSIIIILTKEIC